MQNSASLPLITKKERSKALSVLNFSPEAVTIDTEKLIKEQLIFRNKSAPNLKLNLTHIHLFIFQSVKMSFHYSVTPDYSQIDVLQHTHS
jgi:hypothetical protein